LQPDGDQGNQNTERAEFEDGGSDKIEDPVCEFLTSAEPSTTPSLVGFFISGA